MNVHIEKRINGLASGEIKPEEMLVPGGFDILASFEGTRRDLLFGFWH